MLPLCTAGALEVQILLNEFNQPIEAMITQTFLNLKLIGNDFLQHISLLAIMAKKSKSGYLFTRISFSKRHIKVYD